MEKHLLDGFSANPGLPGNGQLPGSLELAYIGDTVYDLYARGRVMRDRGHTKALHKAASGLVCAAAQSQALGRVEPLLDEREQDVVRRARNAKQHPPKNADPRAYHRATALEALIGFLYLSGRVARLDELMNAALGAEQE